MPHRTPAAPAAPTLADPLSVEIHLCVPDHEEHLMPRRRRAPLMLPLAAPLPRIGEVVNLSTTSSWHVTMVIHAWRSPRALRIEVWLEHLGDASGHMRRAGFDHTH
jgi:hypothetical protein